VAERVNCCFSINCVPAGLSLNAVGYVEWNNQEEEREAKITEWQDYFDSTIKPSLTFALWVESANVTKQHEVNLWVLLLASFLLIYTEGVVASYLHSLLLC